MNDVPRSLADAYRVLNVKPHTSKEVIKKLVDALRVSWHPDLVASESDKKMHTAKIQQINVAWDIINHNS